MKWQELVALARELPETHEDIWYRTPAVKVRSKSFMRLKEDGASVVFMLHSVEQQEYLLTTQPALYFITDHYRGYPAVLARLSKLRKADARERLREAWQVKAPKSLHKALAHGAASPRPGKQSASGPRSDTPEQAIYRVVRTIPRGKVATYGQVAELAGIARGHRVVARAMRSCPERLPWQRVVGKKDARRAQVNIAEEEHARLQRQLLREEGVVFDGSGAIVLDTFGWLPR